MRLTCVLLAAFITPGIRASEPWARHVIDDSSRGADGVRVLDANGDGLPDLVTGWEEGGVIRVYLNPGPELVARRWPAVTVGRVRSPEDAVFVDLDGDGQLDVVSSCEGQTRTIFVHWSPSEPSRYLNAAAWSTAAVPITESRQMWMFALPMQIDGRYGIDLVVGSKGNGASVSCLLAPEDPRDLAAWRLRPLCDAGWIMSLEARDMDQDGDADVLFSDRKGPTRGIHWLENPGMESVQRNMRWNKHELGGRDREVMFLASASNSQGLQSILAAVRGGDLLSLDGPDWMPTEVAMPANCGTGKGVALGDMDLDGQADIVFSCENAKDHKSGVRWLSRTQGSWVDHEISGPEGVKFDRLELLDLDHDGDPDVVTCEETANLGVIWYENPTR